MSEQKTLVYRLEYKDQGPFWNDTSFKLLNKLARRLVPESKQLPECTTFLEYYCANTISPYEDKTFDRYLSRLNEKDTSIQFGFCDTKFVGEAFGFDVDPIYKQQVQKLLETQQPYFVLKAYIVSPLVSSRHEAIYLKSKAELVQKTHSLEEFETW